MVLFQLLWTKLILSEFWQLWIIWPQCSRVMEMWQYLGVRLISCSVTNPNLTILGYEKEPHFLGLVGGWNDPLATHLPPHPLLTNKKPLTKLEICRHNTRGPVRQENRMLSIARLSCACKCSDLSVPTKTMQESSYVCCQVPQHQFGSNYFGIQGIYLNALSFQCFLCFFVLGLAVLKIIGRKSTTLWRI